MHFTKSLPDYSPADGWALSYRVVGDVDGDAVEPSVVTVTAVDAGWDVAIPARATAGLRGGTHRLFGWVTNAGTGERVVIHDERITVTPNVAAVVPSELLTGNQRILAAIDARLEGRVTGDQESVMINGTSLTRIPIEKLSTLRGVYAAKVWQEKHPDESHPRHLVRFGRVR